MELKKEKISLLGVVIMIVVPVAGFIEPATFATLSANYIKMMFPFEVSHFSYWLICAILIAFFTIINFFGVKVLSNIATVVTIVCVVPFIVLIVLSFILTAVPAYLFFKYVYHKGRIWQQTH